ncbi:MAG: hypothetical protein CSA22_08630 [Deltaproteobacteria bacterium]|nr:MAG: hypothetical protein CSA22_08630 [Deltaproteobacteria bacterium]
MCLILFGYHLHPDIPFILAANRDECYQRPSAPLHFWEDNPSLLAGRDLKDRGTWMGITRSGRFAALTNFRAPHLLKTGAPSRGHLVRRFLEASGSGKSYLDQLAATAATYNPFNLLVSDDIRSPERLWFYSNQSDRPMPVSPGVHGLCNHLLDTPWPKVTRATAQLQREAATGRISEARIQTLLCDETRPEDAALPDTGMGLEWEQILSPIFIRSDCYGTRSASLLQLDTSGTLRVTEWTYPTRPPSPIPTGSRREQFTITP